MAERAGGKRTSSCVARAAPRIRSSTWALAVAFSASKMRFVTPAPETLRGAWDGTLPVGNDDLRMLRPLTGGSCGAVAAVRIGESGDLPSEVRIFLSSTGDGSSTEPRRSRFWPDETDDGESGVSSRGPGVVLGTAATGDGRALRHSSETRRPWVVFVADDGWLGPAPREMRSPAGDEAGYSRRGAVQADGVVDRTGVAARKGVVAREPVGPRGP